MYGFGKAKSLEKCTEGMADGGRRGTVWHLTESGLWAEAAFGEAAVKAGVLDWRPRSAGVPEAFGMRLAAALGLGAAGAGWRFSGGVLNGRCGGVPGVYGWRGWAVQKWLGGGGLGCGGALG